MQLRKMLKESRHFPSDETSPILDKPTADQEDDGQPIRDPIRGEIQQMRLTPQE